MFGIGLLELMVVFVVALVVLGPHRLPEAARTLGAWFYRLKEAVESVQSEIEKEGDTPKATQAPEMEQSDPASKASVRGRLHPAQPTEGATQAPEMERSDPAGKARERGRLHPAPPVEGATQAPVMESEKDGD